MSKSPFPFSDLIGKDVVERYGRFKGKIIGLDLNPRGEIKGIVYENGGVILSKNSDSFRVRDGYVEVGPPSILKAEDLISKMDILKLQFEAAYNMKVTQDSYSYVYESVIKDLNEAYEELKKAVDNLIGGLETRRSSLENKKKWMFKLFFNMSVTKKLGGIDDKHYLEAYETLETELFRLDREIEDVSLSITELSHKLKDIEALMIERQASEEVQHESMGERQDEGDGEGYVPTLNFGPIGAESENKVDENVMDNKEAVDENVFREFWG